VRPRAPLDWVDAECARAPSRRRLIAREDWTEMHGAADRDMRAVARFARDAGLTVTLVDSARRAICLSGLLQAAADAFGATIEGRFQAAAGMGEYRARSGPPAPAPPRTGRRRRGVHARPGGRGLRISRGHDRQRPERRHPRAGGRL
jgi:hypothetical protein